MDLARAPLCAAGKHRPFTPVHSCEKRGYVRNAPALALMSAPATPPLMSVIVPVYNVAGHVAACLHSLLGQTLTEFELIVVDDGSTDGSAEIAQQVLGDDPRARLIRQDNQGLGAARNTGLDQAKGQFIAFVDSDDRVMPDYLMRLWQALEETGADWVACALQTIGPEGRGQTHSAIHGDPYLWDHPVPRRYRFDTWSDVIVHFPSAWNKLYRRSLIGDLRFDPGTWFEDHSFFQRLAARTDHILHLPEPLYLQTQGRDGQITGADDDRVFEQFAVLAGMRPILSDDIRPGGDVAFARLAIRLIFERSNQLRDPARRMRFAGAAQSFLSGQGITYAPDPDLDPDIGHIWGLEMAGTLPLTVWLPWEGGADLGPLDSTLNDLSRDAGPRREVLIPCERPDAPELRALLARHPLARAVAADQLQAQSQGRYLMQLAPGDHLTPGALYRVCEVLERSGADWALSGWRAGPTTEAPWQPAFAPSDAPKVDAAFALTAPLLRDLCAPVQARAVRSAAFMGGDLSDPPSPGQKAVYLYDPGLLLGAPAVRTAAPPPVVVDDTPGAPRRVLYFPCAGNGFLRYRMRFDKELYVNFSFLGPDGISIPFHLSLRLKEQLMVWNTRNAHGHWQAEQPQPLGFDENGVEVTIDIRAPQLRVEIDGQERLRFGLTRRFLGMPQLPGLETITHVEAQGDLRVIEAVPQRPGPSLTLDPRLRLRRALPDGAEAAGWRLQAAGDSGTATDLPLTTQVECGAARSLVATLPGRIWQGVAPEAGVTLTLTSPRRLQRNSTLRLTRAMVAQTVTQALTTGLPEGDSTAVISVLEHLQDDALRALVPATARRQALILAQTYGLEALISDADTPALLAGPPDHDVGPIDTALARFAESQRSTPPADPLTVLDGLALPRIQAQQGLFLALSEVFCSTGYDTWGFIARARALPPFHPRGQVWTDSAMLPFLYDRGHPDQVVAVMKSLVPLTEDWELTQPVAWLIRQVLHDGHLPGSARIEILLTFTKYLRKRGDQYWERAHCRELTAAAADLVRITGRDGLPDEVTELALRAPDTVMRVYGLSRVFWEMLADDPDLPPLFLQARRRFAALLAAQEAGNRPEIETHLAYFAQQRCPEVGRWQRDLLGPAGVAVSEPKPADLGSVGEGAPRAALRVCAFPVSTPRDPALADLARRALPDLYPETDRAPYPAAQARLVAAATALRDDPNAPALETFLAATGPLNDAASGWMGLGLMAALVPALPDRLAHSLRSALQTRLDALPAPDQAKAARAPILRQALRMWSEAERSALPLPLGPLPPVPEPNKARLPDPDPITDALVVVFSCRAYLDSRIPAMRASWLGQLAAYGVPYVVVVGDGDGTMDGDVVHLDAPDDYEGLPQKTLAALRWVQDHTRYGHMIKIDDDCFLNAPAFFGALSYRKFHYYGRRLIRPPGQMDRVWHQAKSSSERGRNDFDRSPEPSTYADGGSGYVLSRDGIATALEVAASPAGQRLIAASFMEDKLLGDLLALRGIAVSDEDHRVAIRRRLRPGGVAVSSWLNSFLPSQDAPLSLVHLDREEDQPLALAQSQTTGFAPHKVWPSYQPVRLGYDTNALDLISPLPRVEAARNAEIAVVAAMRNEMFMLPSFLAHYRRLGVGAFLIADNGSDDGTLEYLAEQPDVALFSVDTAYKRSHYGVAWQQAMLGAFRVGRWSLMADADELLVWQAKQSQTLPDLLREADFAGAEAVRLFMLDMYPKGPLDTARFASLDPFAEAGFADAVPFLTRSPTRGPHTDAPAWTSALRHRLIPGSRPNLFVAQKLALLRYQSWMRLSAGLHFIGDTKLARPELIFAHFKYNADFHRKAEAEVARGQHWGNAEEYRKYLALVSEGREVLYDADLSLPWDQVPFVKARLR